MPHEARELPPTASAAVHRPGQAAPASAFFGVVVDVEAAEVDPSLEPPPEESAESDDFVAESPEELPFFDATASERLSVR